MYFWFVFFSSILKWFSSIHIFFLVFLKNVCFGSMWLFREHLIVYHDIFFGKFVPRSVMSTLCVWFSYKIIFQVLSFRGLHCILMIFHRFLMKCSWKVWSIFYRMISFRFSLEFLWRLGKTVNAIDLNAKKWLSQQWCQE